MNLVLIGYRCSGKTTVGRRIAPRLQMRFVDIDDLIEEFHGALISEIVKSHGWDHFRVMEKRVIKEISSEDNIIIAPGGGAVLNPDNVLALRKNGLMVWLKANGQAIRKRMEMDPRTYAQRPTLTGKGTFEELEEVMAYREPLYEKASEVQLDTSTLSVEVVVENIFSIFQKRMGRN